ncbi:MAG: hypothetical protein AAF628_21000 [Planctomycetota bacterium]
MRALSPIAFTLAASLLPAQGVTWIVDQAGGPGSQFAEIAPAVAQAADGDTIVVRNGTYGGFATSKALTVLGEGSVVISDGPGIPTFPFAIEPTVEIHDLPAGAVFVAKNLRIEAHTFRDGLRLEDNQGRVHLQNVSSVLVSWPEQSGTGAWILRSSAVTWNGGQLHGRPCLSATDSLVSLASMQINGSSACGAGICSTIGALEAIHARNSTLQLSRCDVSGGSGFGFTVVFPDGKPAIIANDSALTVTGDDTTSIRAGGPGPGAITPIAAIQANGGTVDLDTLIVTLGSLGGADVSGTATVNRRRIVSLAALGGTLGGTLDAEVVSPPSDLVNLVLSLPIDPVALPPGLVFLDPRLIVPLYVGPQEPTGRVEVSVLIPTATSLRGAAIALQTANLYLPQSTVEFSNPAIVVID